MASQQRSDSSRSISPSSAVKLWSLDAAGLTNRLNSGGWAATPAVLQGSFSPPHSYMSNLETKQRQSKAPFPIGNVWKERSRWSHGSFKKKIKFIIIIFIAVFVSHSQLCQSHRRLRLSSITHWLKTVFYLEGQEGISLYLQIVRLKKEKKWQERGKFAARTLTYGTLGFAKRDKEGLMTDWLKEIVHDRPDWPKECQLYKFPLCCFVQREGSGGVFCLTGPSFHSKAKIKGPCICVAIHPTRRKRRQLVLSAGLAQSSVSGCHRDERPARAAKNQSIFFLKSFGWRTAIQIHVQTREGPAGGEQEFFFSTSVSIPLSGSPVSQFVQRFGFTAQEHFFFFFFF